MLDFFSLPQPIVDLLQKLFGKLKAKFEIGLVPIALAVLTILLGLIGWSQKSPNWSLHSIVLIALESLADFTPNIKNIEGGNKITDAAALCGLLTIYSSAAVIAASALREWRRKLVARVFARDHVLVIGETVLARRAVKVWSRRDPRTLQILSSEADRPDWKGKSVRSELDESLVNGFSMTKAHHVFFDLGEDGATLALSYRLLSKIASDAVPAGEDGTGREWVIVTRDIDMADHFIAKVHDLRSSAPDAPFPRLHFIDPERLAARDLVSKHPLFLEAEKRGNRRIHVLIVGFTSVAWHLVEMTFLSGLTARLDPPIVTILSPQPDVQRRRFYSGRADLARAIDVAFLELDALDDFQMGETEPGRALRKRDEESPVTTIFSVLEESERNTRIVLGLDAIRRKTERLGCPVFTRDEDGGDGDFLASGARFDQIIGGLSAFGLADVCLESELCDSERRDILPRALHRRHVATQSPSTANGAAWNDLSETLRRANRNAAVHWLAKMHMFGFDVRDLPSDILPRLSWEDSERLLAMADQPARFEDDHTFMQVARCEHERWALERQLDGWTLGPRDDERQTHDLLIPWDELVDRHPEQIPKDKEQVKALIICLRDAGNSGVALKRQAQTDAIRPT